MSRMVGTWFKFYIFINVLHKHQNIAFMIITQRFSSCRIELNRKKRDQSKINTDSAKDKNGKSKLTKFPTYRCIVSTYPAWAHLPRSR